ncbi:hypothetical protein CU254_00410 [Amycolatopsis sp. AA4]|nr:hypothetical protein CU254_00410 [Amycolatopsis sp. AA4]
MTSGLVNLRKSEAKPTLDLPPEQAAAAVMVAEGTARRLASTGPDEKNQVEPGRESANVRNGHSA